MITNALSIPARSKLWGRTFVNVPFDYLIIGGVLSLMVTPVIVANPGLTENLSATSLPVLLLLTSSAHFAASTVRLYTKPDTTRELPFVTMLLPAVSLGVLLIALMSPAIVGSALQALYLTWSPYHYAAQAFGLAVMYSYRSGLQLSDGEKKALWWIAMLPFVRAFLGGTSSGLGWFVSRETIATIPMLPGVLDVVTEGLTLAIFVLPIAFVIDRSSRRTAPIPLISMFLLLSNGIWWVVLDYLDAFVWATIFHGVQYLAIAAIFHVKDQATRPDNSRSGTYHAAWFYGVSLALGYAMFYAWPYAFVLAGFGRGESMLLVIAMINVHHFIVDRYIWRIGRDRRNRQLVDAVPTAAAPTPA